MHHTNGVLEDSGKEEGPYSSAQTRDRTLLGPSLLPEDSELAIKSIALRQSIYGNGKNHSETKHYVRKPHHCDNCQRGFSSKGALREHMFDRHSY
jgi:hypothetical protein